MFEIKYNFFRFDDSVNIWRGVQFVKINVLAINSNRLLFSSSEVKMSKNLLSSPLIQNKTDRTLFSTYFSLRDLRQKKGKKKYCRTEW